VSDKNSGSVADDNPLLGYSEYPDWSTIRPEHVEPAVDRVLEENRARLAELLAGVMAPSWANLMAPLEAIQDRLNRVWAPVSHLNNVMASEALRAAHDACLPKISMYHTELGQNAQLFALIKRLRETAQALDDSQRKILDDKLLAFRLAGVDLDPERKARFKAIQSELATLASGFQHNVLRSTDAFTRHFDAAEPLEGLPESALALARQAATAAGKPGWLLTLQAPSYLAVMTHADSRPLRREFYLAYMTRAARTGPHAPELDNTELIERILKLREEAASLLGFDHYAALSLATKMAESAEEVIGFLVDLAGRAVPAARRELAELEAYACEDLGGDSLKPWDVPYYAEKLREARFGISQEALKPWFPVERVLAGMFAIVGRLYGVSIAQVPVRSTWHPAVRLFEIRDSRDCVRGRFFVDLYAREAKRGGAWMDECVNRRRLGERVQIPVAHLVCNLSPPVGDKPALLTHQEVITLFHEFGHGLHHMLTQVDYADAAGINGVEWDAVELPSQFMENWCWQEEALALISGHYQTGEPLPAPEIAKLRSAKNFHAALAMVRQLEFALFDMRIHLARPAPDADRVQAILDAVRLEVAAIIPPAEVRFQNGFGHIFAGGYAAGYYSYKWAEVLSADAFATFLDKGIFDRATGERFLTTILERGGSRKARESFVAFKGREPTVEALLREAGLGSSLAPAR
jgi:oligopeptidase A